MIRTLSWRTFTTATTGGVYAEYMVLLTSIAAVTMGATFALAPRILPLYDTTYVADVHTPTHPHQGSGGGGTLPPPPPPAHEGTDPEGSPTTPQHEGDHTTPSAPPPPEPLPTEPPVVAPPPVVIPPVAPPPPPPEPETPAFAPFDFGQRVFAWNNTSWRATSPYVDIDGVADTPVSYHVTGEGRPMAQANVNGGPSSQGSLRHGTDLQVDVPAPGGTHTATLHNDGRTGTFRVSTQPIGDQTVHHDGQYWLWVPVHWEGRTFSISGQGNPGAQPNGGNTQAYATSPDGRITQGLAKNGFNLIVNTPPKGQRHNLIITIDGQSSSFAIVRP